jgi:hypothetical protein
MKALISIRESLRELGVREPQHAHSPGVRPAALFELRESQDISQAGLQIVSRSFVAIGDGLPPLSHQRDTSMRLPKIGSPPIRSTSTRTNLTEVAMAGEPPPVANFRTGSVIPAIRAPRRHRQRRTRLAWLLACLITPCMAILNCYDTDSAANTSIPVRSS